MPYKRSFLSHEYFASNTVADLKKNLAESVKMLMYLYPHMQSDESFYHFLSHAKNDKHLSRHYFGSLKHVRQRQLYQLARITDQPNLPALYDRYKHEYIDDQLFALREKEKHWEAEEDRLEKEDSSYRRYPFRKPEDPEAEYAKEFDDYVAEIGQG